MRLIPDDSLDALRLHLPNKQRINDDRAEIMGISWNYVSTENENFQVNIEQIFGELGDFYTVDVWDINTNKFHKEVKNYSDVLDALIEAGYPYALSEQRKITIDSILDDLVS